MFIRLSCFIFSNTRGSWGLPGAKPNRGDGGERDLRLGGLTKGHGPGGVQGVHCGGWGSQKDLEGRSQRSLEGWEHDWEPCGQETAGTIRGN